MKLSTSDFKEHYELKANEAKAKCESCKCNGDLKGAKRHESEMLNYQGAIDKVG